MVRSSSAVQLARSLLFVPASRPDRFANAVASGADVVVADLEDGVGPSEKGIARDAAADWVVQGAQAIVRINAANTADHAADVEMVESVQPVAVMVPKADPRGVAELSQFPVVALIETAVGVLAASETCAAPNVIRVALGTVDLATELGCGEDGPPISTAADLLVIASAAAGLPGPIDGVCTSLRDRKVVQNQAAAARRRGYTGKLAIHPDQVAAINEGFSPTGDELEWARRVLASSQGGAIAVDGRMVDEPIVQRARALLERARVLETWSDRQRR